MSFLFNWLSLNLNEIKSTINDALQQANLPQFPQKLRIKTLELGESSPFLELLDIIDFNTDLFKGLFKFKYDGQLSITLTSDLEINSLRLIPFDHFTKPHFILSDKSTVVPVDFTICNISIDAILTVVFKNGKITVVFNDDPLIDLDLETSLDQILDEDLFEMIKKDTIVMATELVKVDLPAILHNISIFEDSDKIIRNLEKEVSNHKKSNEIISNTVPLQHSDISTNSFDTLSLKPKGFSDVVGRNSLSQEEYSTNEVVKFKKTIKRRVIKMKNWQLKSESVPEKQISNQVSTSSSPTLIDTSYQYQDESSLSLEDYLNQETIVLTDSEDPYESLTHPLELLPSFKDSSTPIKSMNSINEKLIRPRGPSSNYINLNDFKILQTSSPYGSRESVISD